MRSGVVGRSIARKWWDVISRMHAYVSAIALFEPHKGSPQCIYSLTTRERNHDFTQATKHLHPGRYRFLVACSSTKIALRMPLSRVLLRVQPDVNRIT